MRLLSFFILISFLATNTIFAKEQQIIKIGEKYSNLLITSLKKELKYAIKNNGILNAVKVCSTKAQKITNEISNKSNGITVRRTSLKYRNPLNKPDKNEIKALKFFQTHKTDKYYIQKVEKDGKIFYNYYKKLKTTRICLKCHGNPSKIPPELLNLLKKLYPKDKAIGYKAGEFRGVIKVSIPNDIINN